MKTQYKSFAAAFLLISATALGACSNEDEMAGPPPGGGGAMSQPDGAATPAPSPAPAPQGGQSSSGGNSY